MIPQGVYTDLSNDEYHEDTNSISRSAIMAFRDSPYKYWARYLNPNRPPKKMTDAMEFGKAFHEFVLEPEEFKKHFVTKPTKVLLKNVGREKYEEYKKICADLEETNMIVLDDEDYLKLVDMRDALMNHPRARELIEGAMYERSYFWEDEHSGLMVKARPDILHDNLIVDLKTCANASPRAFQYAMIDGGYHIQGAMVREGVNIMESRDIPTIVNIPIEKEYPHSIGVYVIDEFALDEGRMQYKQALLDIKNARADNEYPDYPVQSISLPKWAL